MSNIIDQTYIMQYTCKHTYLNILAKHVGAIAVHRQIKKSNYMVVILFYKITQTIIKVKYVPPRAKGAHNYLYPSSLLLLGL